MTHPHTLSAWEHHNHDNGRYNKETWPPFFLPIIARLILEFMEAIKYQKTCFCLSHLMWDNSKFESVTPQCHTGITLAASTSATIYFLLHCYDVATIIITIIEAITVLCVMANLLLHEIRICSTVLVSNILVSFRFFY